MLVAIVVIAVVVVIDSAVGVVVIVVVVIDSVVRVVVIVVAVVVVEVVVLDVVAGVVVTVTQILKPARNTFSSLRHTNSAPCASRTSCDPVYFLPATVRKSNPDSTSYSVALTTTGRNVLILHFSFGP